MIIYTSILTYLKNDMPNSASSASLQVLLRNKDEFESK